MAGRPKAHKPWAGRFERATDRLVEEFSSSLSFDTRLLGHDILGSIAHAMVLNRAGVLTDRERTVVVKGLKAVEAEMLSGAFAMSPGLEDVHMAVERRLIEKIGPLGGKLHTGRSRNDQVALDVRLYLKDEIFSIAGLLHELKKALVEKAEENIGCVMPGYTHLQRAQPVLFSHHMLAYYEMFKRDTGRLLDCLDRADSMPLGSGALAGSPYALDRRLAARLLGFARVTENSMDAVADRDFIVEFLSASAVLMMHLSRLSEEIILWSTSEFGFIELPDEFATGSSIMPQKKNPDVAELARGKTGRVYGNLVALLTVMKGLPLAYNRDMQEDKEPLFDTVDTVKGALGVFAPMLRRLTVKRAVMEGAASSGFLNATDAADYLAGKGLPFREAHSVAGRAVAYCIKKGKRLEDLGMDEWRSFSGLFEEDIREAVSLESSVNARRVHGGTALKAVKARLRAVRRELKRGGC
jgi:argininosuccinate lyase